jgi:hypothetical protein
MEQVGSGFIEELKKSLCNDLTNYKTSPLYVYYYQFLKPIKYLHPEYKECESSYWSLLFQLLFAEGNDVKIIKGKNDYNLPEIEFAFSKYERRKISSLTLDELRNITYILARKAFTGTLVNISSLSGRINADYANILRERDESFMLKEDWYAIFNASHSEFIDEDIEFLDRCYERIKECEIQTFPYVF